MVSAARFFIAVQSRHKYVSGVCAPVQRLSIDMIRDIFMVSIGDGREKAGTVNPGKAHIVKVMFYNMLKITR